MLKISRFVQGVIDGIASENTAIYNPVFFCGNTKDVACVLDLVTLEYGRRNPEKRIVRVSGEGFRHVVLNGIVRGDLQLALKNCSTCNLFVFENAELIEGQLVTMKEFYGVFDRIFEAGGQIVVGSAILPSDMPALEDRVRTQFEAGIVCSVYE